jgi:hypothetical protein
MYKKYNLSNIANQFFLILRYSCHTQGVERCVKLVSEAAKHVEGQQTRHGFILSTVDSRKKMPVLCKNVIINVIIMIYIDFLCFISLIIKLNLTGKSLLRKKIKSCPP